MRTIISRWRSGEEWSPFLSRSIVGNVSLPRQFTAEDAKPAEEKQGWQKKLANSVDSAVKKCLERKGIENGEKEDIIANNGN